MKTLVSWTLPDAIITYLNEDFFKIGAVLKPDEDYQITYTHIHTDPGTCSVANSFVILCLTSANYSLQRFSKPFLFRLVAIGF